MQYKAAIFDLDGTLVDTLEDLAISVNEMLKSYGFPTHTVEEYRYFLGNGSKKLIERTLPKDKAQDEAFVLEAMKRYQEIYEHHRDHTGPFKGIQPLLDKLKDMGIPMGVCTNKHQQAADEIIGGMFPKGTFTTVMGDRPGLPIKPDPTKPLMMAKEYGVKPEEVAYFGDTSVDMDTAVNAGFLPIGVLWGFRPEKELLEHGAKVILAKPEELFEKVEFAVK
ncbi:HAD family hydrolase [Mitsuokella sp.]|uniref:HAD family hydrolase n=1 Tax=unclassified Mitsuokella TaxID=2637239 RepID=UPI003D7C4575